MRLAVVALYAPLLAAEWSVDHSFRFRTIGEVVPSPDGSVVAWTESAAVMEKEKSEWVTHIFVAPVAQPSQRYQLTRGDKSCTAPQFSPDSRHVYFLSSRSGTRAVYRILLAGGEAERITETKAEIASFAVSPDHRWVALTGAPEDKDADSRKKEKTDFKVVDDKPRNHALWTVSLDSVLPAETKRVVKADYHVSNIGWSPDSRQIAFEHRPRPDMDVARHSDIAEVEAGSGEVRELAATAGTEQHPIYSPDARYLLFVRSAPKARSIDGGRLTLLTRATGEVRELPVTPNEEPLPIGWRAVANDILFVEARGTRTIVYRMPVDGPAQPLYVPKRGTLGYAVRANAAGTHLGFVEQAASVAPEAYVLKDAGGAPVQVSSANTAIELPPIGKTELLKWKSKDGLDIEGLLTYPASYTAGTAVPLILYVHGGPSGMFSETFLGAAGHYPLAAMSAKGWAILRANPRGSTAYGKAFRARVVQDWGGLDLQDLLSGVDHCINVLKLADANRLAIVGWSYGGYMTAWTVTQTTRFKAAVMGAAITNHVSMYGTQDIPSVYEGYFGGAPWAMPAVYAKSSPINYVSRVKTPMLILHGEADQRVPVTQGYEYYRALKRQGVPTRMVVFPRQGHGITEPKFQKQVMQEHLDWLEQYLR